ncbi:MAG: protein-glutamate methylesterase/protein-glutamine glutaminase [Gammaproteobacteria bacterium]
MRKIRVLIVDDSALIRSLLTEILRSTPDIEVVGTAADPLIAREKIKKLNPDVLTLDIEMPRMDGITFLRNLMRLRPMPVVMVSTLTEKGAELTLKALEMGAVDFIAKPKMDVVHTLHGYAEEIVGKVKMAAATQVQALTAGPVQQKPGSMDKTGKVEKAGYRTPHSNAPLEHLQSSNKLIAIGASTGGTEAIKTVVSHLPVTAPAIVVTQHLPVAFSASFARHVNEVSAMAVCVAQHGQRILPGHVYIAPGDRHLLINRDGAHHICYLDNGPPVNRHKPSVEVMFRSIAQSVGNRAIGVMLTGMGTDGALAMKEMHDAGSVNIIQDEASSVVWGMPGEVYKIGAADYVQPLHRIADQLLALAG